MKRRQSSDGVTGWRRWKSVQDLNYCAMTSILTVCFHLPNTSPFSLSLLRVLEVFGLNATTSYGALCQRPTSRQSRSRQVYWTDGKRPDGVTLIPWKDGKCATWDVTVTDTMAQSYLPITSQTSGAAAEASEDSQVCLTDTGIFVHTDYSWNRGSYQQRRYWISGRPGKAHHSSYWWQPRESLPVSTAVCADSALQRGRHSWHICPHNPWGRSSRSSFIVFNFCF